MIYLYGAGGHAKVIAEILEACQLPISGFISDFSDKESLLSYPMHKATYDLLIDQNTKIIISIGSNSVRKKLALSLNANFAVAIHPSANISRSCAMGDGTVVMAGVSISSSVTIGKHSIINTNSSIDHDCILSDFVHISPNVALGGSVTVGEGTHLGIGSCVIQGIKIGNWATIGAGAVIINDVPDHAVVVGNPGKIIKYNNDNG
ncbi:acetyltransferase [Mucilaginibacter sp. UR6-11]|uniref:acetyltransferase n=1 Tax=Mucilaginibacter sp. UR6-11 TaxID=1435644 RepID=UPI001E32A303|nr:acetyltransferase [Mucilaginibacter sp. UR6-11]MCC8424872.1 acetyltransferase [Mucilaginibacter sp. UR6-11]